MLIERLAMNKYFSLFIFLFYFFLNISGSNYVDYVNPLIGTQSSYELSAGNTYPAIAMPWGMNFWTPQTGKMGNGWQYTYTSNKIRGFKQTHQPSPWINDYGQFSIMPIVGKLVFDEEHRSSWFSHKGEEVKPYYYKVYLAEYDIVTELVPTERAAMFRFTFPKNDKSYVIVDAFDEGSFVKIDISKNRILGYTTKNSGGVPDNFRNYFIIEFDKPFTYTAAVSNKAILENKLEIKTEHAGAIIGFSTKKGEIVHAKVASSFISFEQAEYNLRELGQESFVSLMKKGKETWNEVLDRIEVDGGNLDQYRTFYSCLYRSLLFPRKLYEISPKGEILHYSPYNGKVLSGYMYTDTGFWDTFRSLFPLLNLVYPSVNKEIQESLINVYKESGFFPEWASPGHRNCMIGNNSASVLVDAYMKNVKVDDVEILYKGLINGTENVHNSINSTGRLGYEYYNDLGYVPCDVNIKENAARTLEYSYNDWCIYRIAKELKRPKEEISRFEKRALNYKNLFDKDTKLMRGKRKNGEFTVPFSPLKWGDTFTEGNSWHYTWSVFHDPQGLINLMGGYNEFVNMLDSVFIIPPLFDESYYGKVIHEIREMTVMNMGNYAHGNQPIQHMIYLYNYAKQPWKTQYWIREVMNRMYSPTPDGYCGDEDNGQTSAWYVFSALGFYPVCPGSDEYVVGAPLFKHSVIHLENGKNIIINAPENDNENIYIKRMLLDGRVYDNNYLKHSSLLNGVNIYMEMNKYPNKKRGINDDNLPYSFSNSK